MSNKTPKHHYPHPSLKGINYVLFPHDKWVQHWDNFFLCVLFYYCFSIPYTVGVSGGYWMYKNGPWFIANLFLNAVYVGKRVKWYCVSSWQYFNPLEIAALVDTFMQFFRAYYDENGIIVYDLRRISKHYVTSGHFFMNLLASAPMQVSFVITDIADRFISTQALQQYLICYLSQHFCLGPT